VPSCVPWSLLNGLFLDHAPLFAMDLFPALFARKPKGSSLTSGCHSCHQEHTMETHLCTRCWDGCKKRKTWVILEIGSWRRIWIVWFLMISSHIISWYFYDVLWSSTWFPKQYQPSANWGYDFQHSTTVALQRCHGCEISWCEGSDRLFTLTWILLTVFYCRDAKDLHFSMRIQKVVPAWIGF